MPRIKNFEVDAIERGTTPENTEEFYKDRICGGKFGCEHPGFSPGVTAVVAKETDRVFRLLPVAWKRYETVKQLSCFACFFKLTY